MPEEMAEAAAKSVGDTNQLATKADLAKLEVRLTNKIYALDIGIVISQTALTVLRLSMQQRL